MGRYEVQILDSYDNKTYFDGQCGAIYKQQPPMVNACRKPGEWQTYDIIFNAPAVRRRRHGDKRPATSRCSTTACCVQNHFELLGATSYDRAGRTTRSTPTRQPMQLQFHGNPVRFRNIWIRENIKPLVGLNPDPRPNATP